MPGLIVNGTITRTPVASGAELVGYSGFSASNYLEQPYNPSLDFGTGDFCVMGWVKYSLGDSTIIYRGADIPSPSPTNGLNVWVYNQAIKVRFAGLTVSNDSLQPLSANVWCMATFVRNGNTFLIYVNGTLVYSVNSAAIGAATLAGTGHILRLGSGYYTGAGNTLALWRISASAPTAEQIAKIYRDELPLFQENAACTLYGSSDAVTAISHDKATDRLQVGTSQGRSTFKGLRRIEYDTTPVTKAISANRNRIVQV